MDYCLTELLSDVIVCWICKLANWTFPSCFPLMSSTCTSMCSVHYNDVMMIAMASQITSLTIVYTSVYPGVDQIKHQSSALLAFVRGIHRWPVNSPHKGPVTRKMLPFDDVIMSGPFMDLKPGDILKTVHSNLSSSLIMAWVASRWVTKEHIDDKWTLGHVMAWCYQAHC